MPLFRYKAARNDGTVIDGQLEAADEQRAAQVLQAQGHVPIQIDSAVGQAASGVTSQVRRSSKANAATIDFFTLELATLLRAGLPLAQALETLTGLADSPAMAELAESVNTLVRDGQSLSNALEQTHPGFDAFYCNMVRAGESSGALDLALERLAEFRASRRELRNSLISALIYPVILLVMALIAVAVLLAFVVPQFTQMFADAGRDAIAHADRRRGRRDRDELLVADHRRDRRQHLVGNPRLAHANRPAALGSLADQRHIGRPAGAQTQRGAFRPHDGNSAGQRRAPDAGTGHRQRDRRQLSYGAGARRGRRTRT